MCLVRAGDARSGFAGAGVVRAELQRLREREIELLEKVGQVDPLLGGLRGGDNLGLARRESNGVLLLRGPGDGCRVVREDVPRLRTYTNRQMSVHTIGRFAAKALQLRQC